MTHDLSERVGTRVAEEAATWFIEFRTGWVGAADRKAFDAWLRRSQEHVSAYLEIAAIWNETGTLAAHRDLDVDALIALADDRNNVVRLDLGREESPPRAQARSDAPVRYAVERRCWRQLAASLAVVCAGLAAFWFVAGASTVATGVGEQRSITLADGSTVSMNSRSRISVRFTRGERLVELLEGQALFKVHKDALRPFVVRSRATSVRAVGTQFDVYNKGRRTIVTVVEGRVAVAADAVGELQPVARRTVTPAPAPRSAIMLSSGEQLTVSAGQTSRPTQVDVGAATAWQQRRLVLRGYSLAELAEEMNRYSTRRLVVADRGVPELRLSGVFTTDPSFLIRYLKERSDISVRETDEEILITRR
ncbi:MAG: FecR domain-containing protein [Steroidobacteraceae bacterium]